MAEIYTGVIAKYNGKPEEDNPKIVAKFRPKPVAVFRYNPNPEDEKLKNFKTRTLTQITKILESLNGKINEVEEMIQFLQRKNHSVHTSWGRLNTLYENVLVKSTGDYSSQTRAVKEGFSQEVLAQMALIQDLETQKARVLDIELTVLNQTNFDIAIVEQIDRSLDLFRVN